MLLRTPAVCLAFLITIVLVTPGCDLFQPKQVLKFDSEYQAVFLSNGQVFFGKIENAGAAYPVLRDVFYVQTRVDAEKKQPVNILLKRGSEWHGPDFMYINSNQIVVIEPVAKDSRVAQLIAEAKKQQPAGQK